VNKYELVHHALAIGSWRHDEINKTSISVNDTTQKSKKKTTPTYSWANLATMQLMLHYSSIHMHNGEKTVNENRRLHSLHIRKSVVSADSAIALLATFVLGIDGAPRFQYLNAVSSASMCRVASASFCVSPISRDQLAHSTYTRIDAYLPAVFLQIRTSRCDGDSYRTVVLARS